MNNQKKLFIHTIGCAMNVRDSEHIIAELSKKDYITTDNPKEADLIILNSCSVRDKPERKLFSEIGQFKKLKKNGAKIGVCGCTASHLGAEIIKKTKVVSFVIGARNVSKIAQVLDKEGAVEIDIDYDDTLYPFENYYGSPYKAMINISLGCDMSCAYCIVPFTRGQEVSIPLNLILDETKKAVDSGRIEVLLLGQNVNNYGRRFGGNHEDINFAKLLRELSKIDGLERIRFTSPHPLHCDDEFIEEFASNDKICKSIHFPLQSGSNNILKLMNRGYTKEWYIKKIDKLKSMCPQITISTDIIVGFPQESEEDFLDTMDVLEYAKFFQLFSFVYSKRPYTSALELKDEVDLEVAKERLDRLQKRHKAIIEKNLELEFGNIQKTLFEEFDNDFFIGRTDTNRVIKVKSKENLLGLIKNIKITQIKKMELFGELV